MVGEETRSCWPLGRAKPSPACTMQVLGLFPVPQHEDHGTLRDLQRPGDINKTHVSVIDQPCHPRVAGISQQRRHLHTAHAPRPSPIVGRLSYAAGPEKRATNDRKADYIGRVFKSEPSRIFADEFTLHPPPQSPTCLSVHRCNGFIQASHKHPDLVGCWSCSCLSVIPIPFHLWGPRARSRCLLLIPRLS